MLEAEVVGDSIQVTLYDTRIDQQRWAAYDGIVLATGYRYQGHDHLLTALRPWIVPDVVARSYQLPMTTACSARVFLQGCCEETHGLSDTLLSVLAVRAEEVVASLYAGTWAETGLRDAG